MPLPYEVRPIDHLISDLPASLKSIFETYWKSARSNCRLWIEATAMPVKVDASGRVLNITFGEERISIKTRALSYNYNGILEANEVDPEGWPIYLFADLNELNQAVNTQSLSSSSAILVTKNNNKVFFYENKRVVPAPSVHLSAKQWDDLYQQPLHVSKQILCTVNNSEKNEVDNSHFLYDITRLITAQAQKPHCFSPERELVEALTAHYDELARYFPEFARVKQLCAMFSLIKILRNLREKNMQDLRKQGVELADPTFWAKQKEALMAEIAPKITQGFTNNPDKESFIQSIHRQFPGSEKIILCELTSKQKSTKYITETIEYVTEQQLLKQKTLWEEQIKSGKKLEQAFIELHAEEASLKFPEKSSTNSTNKRCPWIPSCSYKYIVHGGVRKLAQIFTRAASAMTLPSQSVFSALSNNQQLIESKRLIKNLRELRFPVSYTNHPIDWTDNKGDFARRNARLHAFHLSTAARPAITQVVRYISNTTLGVSEGLTDLGHIAIHPYKNFVKPTGILLWDLSILSAAHFPFIQAQKMLDKKLEGHEEFTLLRSSLKNNIKIYEESAERMTKRFQILQEGIEYYFDPSTDTEERLRMLGRFYSSLRVSEFIVAKANLFMQSCKLPLNEKPILFESLEKSGISAAIVKPNVLSTTSLSSEAPVLPSSLMKKTKARPNRKQAIQTNVPTASLTTATLDTTNPSKPPSARVSSNEIPEVTLPISNSTSSTTKVKTSIPVKDVQNSSSTSSNNGNMNYSSLMSKWGFLSVANAAVEKPLQPNSIKKAVNSLSHAHPLKEVSGMAEGIVVHATVEINKEVCCNEPPPQEACSRFRAEEEVSNIFRRN